MSETADGLNGSSGNGSARTPPYIPFQTMLTLFDELRTNGIPAQIDRSVLKRFSGATGTQLLGAVRALALVDGEDRPTPRLVELVNAEGEALKPLLNELLRDSYPYIFKLDLLTATPSMFADAFKNNTGAKEDVLRKCRTFFIHAAKRAEIPLGSRLQSGGGPRAPRGTGVKRKPKVTAPKDGAPADVNVNNGGGAGAPPGSAYMEALLAKFPTFDPAWPDAIKAKWFEGFEQFMKGAAPK